MKTSKVAVVLSIIVFLFIVVAGILAFLNSPPPAFKSGVRFRVEKGETALAVGNRLEESGLIRNSGITLRGWMKNIQMKKFWRCSETAKCEKNRFL